MRIGDKGILYTATAGNLLIDNGDDPVASIFYAAYTRDGGTNLDQSLCGNVTFRYYPSGHMVYLNPDARKAFRADLASFYDNAASP